MSKFNQKLLFLFIGLFLVFSFLLAGCDKKQPVISDNNNANNVSDNNNTTQNNNNVNNGNNNNQQNNNQNGDEDPYKDWKTYRNEEYGFEVKIPKNWPQFNVRERNIIGATVFLEFGFLTEDKKSADEKGFYYPWGILIFTENQYQNYSFPDETKPEIIDQNSKYVFTMSISQDTTSDLIEQTTNYDLVFSTFQMLP